MLHVWRRIEMSEVIAVILWIVFIAASSTFIHFTFKLIERKAER